MSTNSMENENANAKNKYCEHAKTNDIKSEHSRSKQSVHMQIVKYYKHANSKKMNMKRVSVVKHVYNIESEKLYRPQMTI